MMKTMLIKLLKNLNLRAGEYLPVAMLLVFSMCNGVFVAFFLTAANGAFLSQATETDLPVAYILTGFVGYLVTLFFSKMERRIAFSRLIPGALVIILILIFSFCVGARGDAFHLSLFGRSLNPITWMMFISLFPILVLLDLSFWGIAGRLFNLQQGKRLFGLISSGEVVAAIASYFTIKLWLPYSMKTGAMLILIAAVGLSAATLVMFAMVKRFHEQLLGQGAEQEQKVVREEGDPRTFPYFLLIAAVTFCMIFVLYFVDFAFMIQVQQRYPEEEEMAGFFALFFGCMCVAELLVKTFVSGRLIRSFGLAVGMRALPVTVFLCMGLAALQVHFASIQADMFFIFLALAKLSEFVLRRSLFEPSFKVLFQPLPENKRFAMQARVDGVVNQLSLGVTGICLLLMVRVEEPMTLVINMVLLVIVIMLALSVFLYKEYHSRLLEALSSKSTKITIPSPGEALSAELSAASPEEMICALNVLEHMEPSLLEDLLAKLLKAPDSSLREAALKRISALRLISLRKGVEDLIAEEREEPIRNLAKNTLKSLERVNHVPSDKRLSALVQKGSPRDRVYAAVVLGNIQTQHARGHLFKLLWDKDFTVRGRAILNAGSSGRPEFWPRLIDLLASGKYCKLAASALVSVGPPILEADLGFNRYQARIETRKRVLRVLERVGTEKAEHMLFSLINDPNRRIKKQALYSLSHMGYKAQKSEMALIKEQITKTVDRITWTIAARLDIEDLEGDHLLKALKYEKLRNITLLYRLLALICDHKALELIQKSINGNPETRAFALEVAEQTFPLELKDLIIPLFEYLTPAQTLSRLHLHCPRESMGPRKRLENILAHGPSTVGHWTRACAIDALRQNGGDGVPDALIAHIYSHDVMLREMAAWAIYQLDPPLYQRMLRKLPVDQAESLANLLPGQGQKNGLLHFEKVFILEQSPLFSDIAKSVLADIAIEAREICLQTDQCLFREGDSGNSLFIVVDGSIRAHRGSQVITQLTAGQMFGEIAVVETGVRTLSASADEPTRLIMVQREALFNIMADHLEIIAPITRVIAGRRARA